MKLSMLIMLKDAHVIRIKQQYHSIQITDNPIPPRSRARCCADSPRRGEYGASDLLGGYNVAKSQTHNEIATIAMKYLFTLFLIAQNSVIFASGEHNKFEQFDVNKTAYIGDGQYKDGGSCYVIINDESGTRWRMFNGANSSDLYVCVGPQCSNRPNIDESKIEWNSEKEITFEHLLKHWAPSKPIAKTIYQRIFWRNSIIRLVGNGIRSDSIAIAVMKMHNQGSGDGRKGSGAIYDGNLNYAIAKKTKNSITMKLTSIDSTWVGYRTINRFNGSIMSGYNEYLLNHKWTKDPYCWTHFGKC